MPIETITITIAGANPQTKTLQINVDPNTGSGSGTVSYVGNNGGADTIHAASTIAGNNYTSNAAFEAFQPTNGQVAVLTPQPAGLGFFTYTSANHETFYPISGTVYSGLQFTTPIFNQVGNNQPISGVVTDDGNSGQYKHLPPLLDQCKTDGTAVSPGTISATSLPSMSNVAGYFVFKGQFIVSQAGYQTFYFLVDDAWGFYVGNGATRYDGTFNTNSGDGGGGVPSTWDSIPLQGARNTAANEIQAADYVRMHFPNPGIYSFRFVTHNNADKQTYGQMSYTPGLATVTNGVNQEYGAVIKPVATQANPNATVPAGNLQLSVTQNTPYIQGQTATINVTVTGIHYSTKPYIPIFEGTTGKVFLYNNPSSNVYNFPTFTSEPPVDKTAAASKVFAISGSNGSWQGRLSVVYNDAADGNFSLKYSGAALDANVDLTNLTITAEDIAWFHNANKSFDTFAVNGGLGGNQAQIEIDYMVKPTVSSVSPTTVTADGGVKNIVVALNKPFSPQQQGANNTGNVVNAPVFTCPGCTVGTPVPNIVNGWLVSYTVPITVPSNSSTTTTSLGMTLTGTLTYLNGSTFTVGGGVTYIPTHTIATLTLTGVSFTAPSISAFSVSPKTGTAPNYTIVSGASETLTATVQSDFNNAMTCAFWRQSHGTTTRVNMGNGTLSNSFTSGGKFFKVFTFSQANTSWYTVNDLGAQATDTVSSLQSNLYFDSSTYTKTSGGGGGGGGGGCPSIEMFLDESHQVSDVFVGLGLDCLVGDNEMQFIVDPRTELGFVREFEFHEAICYKFTTENGAQVVVSGTTPIPTREAIEVGAVVRANEVFAGVHVLTNVGNGPEWSLVTETECVGMRRIAHIDLGGRTFAAGVKPGKYIYTHNLIIVS